MPAARPSKASVENVLAAMKAAGIVPGAVRVGADGSFTVEPAVPKAPDQAQDGPRRFGAGR